MITVTRQEFKNGVFTGEYTHTENQNFSDYHENKLADGWACSAFQSWHSYTKRTVTESGNVYVDREVVYFN